jgi:hypothetical protein
MANENDTEPRTVDSFTKRYDVDARTVVDLPVEERIVPRMPTVDDPVPVPATSVKLAADDIGSIEEELHADVRDVMAVSEQLCELRLALDSLDEQEFVVASSSGVAVPFTAAETIAAKRRQLGEAMIRLIMRVEGLRKRVEVLQREALLASQRPKAEIATIGPAEIAAGAIETPTDDAVFDPEKLRADMEALVMEEERRKRLLGSIPAPEKRPSVLTRVFRPRTAGGPEVSL